MPQLPLEALMHLHTPVTQDLKASRAGATENEPGPRLSALPNWEQGHHIPPIPDTQKLLSPREMSSAFQVSDIKGQAPCFPQSQLPF